MSEKKSPDSPPVPVTQVHTDLGKLTRSVDTMMAAMQEMESTLCDSNQKLPQASQQLDKIFTHAGATVHHMLITIEQIVEDQERITEELEAVRVFVRGSRAKGKDEALRRAESIAKRAADAQNTALKLMDSLQFHEIASRKGRQITRLLKDIECRMNYLQDVLGQAPTGTVKHPPKASGCSEPVEFDLADSKDQDEVDLIVSQIIDQST